jgi:hypothetical protein
VALAMLDALLSPEWQDRYYSFNQRWSLPSGTRTGSMRNGSGDDLFILFFPDGSALHRDADVGPIATELDEIGYPLAVRG